MMPMKTVARRSEKPGSGFRAAMINLLWLALFASSVACRKPADSKRGFSQGELPGTTLETNNVPSHLWTQFRGADQGRVSSQGDPPTTWSEGKNVLWKTEIPGSGASSPIIAEGKVWLTTSTDDDRSLRALALDVESGAILLNQEVFNLAATPPKHRVNNPASPTPVAEGGKLFVSFGTHGAACLATSDGSILWKNTELQFDDEKMGPGASALLAGEILVLSCDGTDKRFIAGLNKNTGQIVWKTDRSNPIATAIPYRKAFSTPLLAALNGVEQIISSSSFRLFGYEPASGKELWSAEIPGFCPIPVPTVRSNRIYVCTGYNKAELWAFEAQDGGKPPLRVWKTTRSVPLISSPVLVRDFLYFVSQEGIASCVEAESGDLLWNERLGGTYWASPLYAKGRVYFFAENGTTTILPASPEFSVLAKNKLDGEIMATPAAFEDSLILRTKTHLYRLQSSRAETKVATRR